MFEGPRQDMNTTETSENLTFATVTDGNITHHPLAEQCGKMPNIGRMKVNENILLASYNKLYLIQENALQSFAMLLDSKT